MNRFSLSQVVLATLSFALLLASFILVLNPSARLYLTNLVQSTDREVIATLETSLSMPNKKFKVLKIRSKSDLWIEVYDLSLSEDRVAQFQLLGKVDGQMFVNKKSSSLFASDLDGDQILEIIAPSFDSKLHPKVHAFRYNPITDSFSEISDQDLLQKLSI
ncbi:MAG: hypothetical protein ACRBBP_00990 [Bdellovibrionales bacterium]